MLKVLNQQNEEPEPQHGAWLNDYWTGQLAAGGAPVVEMLIEQKLYSLEAKLA